MEDHKDQFITILAGYEREMEWFLSTNPGLPSRFPIQIHFPDYDAEALVKIAKRAAAGRQYRLSPEAELVIRRRIRQTVANRQSVSMEPFSNARFVRNLIERAVRKQAVRLFDVKKLERNQLLTLEATDFAEGASE